jgi:syntaxin-binding protein 1
MVHELLPLKEEDKTYYKTIVNAGSANEEVKEMELGEQDKIWIQNRHMHMKDLLTKLVADFNKFRADHPQFADESSNASTLNNIKDMIAGLPQFQQGKELYSLHLNMAQECMNVFSQCKLPDVASVEQSMATGVDEDYKKPKNLTNQLIRLLDDEAIGPSDRMRLIMQYILYRDGIFSGDIEKLLAHAQLPAHEAETIHNLDILGARIQRQIKDPRPPPQPLFPRKPPPPPCSQDDMSLSRFEPVLKSLLEKQLRGTLDQTLFPYTKPLLDGADAGQVNVSQSSLRSAKPTWARTRPSAMEPRQRLIVFMAGGATYSESRSCYEISRQYSKDVYMATSHMLTPSLFLRQMADLSVDRRRLDLPADRPKPQAPAHIYEREAPAPVQAMAALDINAARNGAQKVAARKAPVVPSPSYMSSAPQQAPAPSKAEKSKKRGFFKF